MTTEAVIVDESGKVTLREVRLPSMSATRVRLRTLISGISCGTEADGASGRATYMKRPYLSGYQAVARVVETGDRITKVKPGDLVVTTGGGLWGLANVTAGSHARDCVDEEAGVVRLDSATPSLSTAAYAVLAAVGYEGVSRMKLVPGKLLAVFGLGMLGQFVGRIGQLLGLRIVGVNRSAWKRDAALNFAFDAACGPTREALQEAIEPMGFEKADFAFDTTGKQEILNLALNALANNGELSLGGYYPEKILVDFDVCHSKNLTIHNPVGPGDYIPNVVTLIEQGKINADSLIRHRIRPSEVTSFYAGLVENHSSYLGAVIDWEG